MKVFNDQEAALLLALQRGIPLCERPFAELGAANGATETQTLELIKRLLEQGDVRRFGAVFDARRLGYRSALCAMLVPAAELEATAARVTTHGGVTHAYERGWPTALPNSGPGAPGVNQWPNFWFTLSAPSENFVEELEKLRAACAPYLIYDLPAVRRFKIDVVFDLRTRERDERVEPKPNVKSEQTGVVTFTEQQRTVIRLLQGSVPLSARFFEPLAQELGMSEHDLIEQLRTWQANGVLRRLGLLLHHREVGFNANGMCCWEVPEAEVMAAGRRVAEFTEVTHCYARPNMEVFPFTLYAMIHKPTWGETQQLFDEISQATGLQDGQLLLSVREFKKTSMSFFQ